MAEHEQKTLMKQGAKIIFRNFAGNKREPYNPEGARNFSLILEPELAKRLLDEGWRVKQLKGRIDDEGVEQPGDYHLKVNVNYATGRPPRCVMITTKNPRTELGSEEVHLLDAVDIKNCDVMINGSWSDMAGGGYSGYLKTIFVTLNEDELELMYDQVIQDTQDAGMQLADPEPAY